MGVEAQLLETACLDLADVPSFEVDQRAATPQCQRLPDHVEGSIRLSEREQFPGPLDQPLEAVGVDLVRGNREPVPGGQRLDGLRSELLPQPNDAALNHLGPRGRRTLAPQRIGEQLRADHIAAPQRQRRKHDAVTRPEAAHVVADSQRPKDRDPPHTGNVPPGAAARQRH